jgi:hypothetical protein
MGSPSFAPNLPSRRRISLAEIDVTVAARLGPTRGLGNSQPSCFNRQVAMYLARHLGRWSTTMIGRFYDGRDHSTVCHSIQRIQALRESNPDVDALLSALKRELDGSLEPVVADLPEEEGKLFRRLGRSDLEELANMVAARVCRQLAKDRMNQRDS